jgi:hypothetical protein
MQDSEHSTGAEIVLSGATEPRLSDVVLTPFDSKAFRKVHDGSPGHAVNGLGRQSGEAGLGTDINSAAALLGGHDASGGLAREEGCLQVYCEREVQIPSGWPESTSQSPPGHGDGRPLKTAILSRS